MDKRLLDIWQAVFEEELRQQQAADKAKPAGRCRKCASRQIHPHHNT